MSLRQIGIQLQYSLGPADQRGDSLSNPLFELLRALHETGSILRSSKSLGLSYRHVWGTLKRWEETLGQPLVVWAQGQPALLTPFAERLLWGEIRTRARLTPHIEALRVELGRAMQEALDGAQLLLTIYASHDMALPLLGEQARDGQNLHIELRFCGSVDALQALSEGRCQVAGFHVPDWPRGSERFADEMKARLHPGEHKLIACTRRAQGLIVARGNPLGLLTLQDVAQAHVRFVNRQPGSGTRLITEHLLGECGITSAQLPGWDTATEETHAAVAAAVAAGQADVGMGIAAAAHSFGLDFVPLLEENYYLVCLRDALELLPVVRLRQVLARRNWRDAVSALPGYRAAEGAGDVLSLTRALPWWSFEPRKPSPPAKPAKPATARTAGPAPRDSGAAQAEPETPAPALSRPAE